MRCNPKYFELGNSKEAFERQEFDGRVVELYYMNDFDETFTPNLIQGRFAMWTSVDGINYRLYLEKGFHEEVKALYSPAVNKIWLDYWDNVDKFSKKVNFKMILPVFVLLIIALVVMTLLVKDNKVATVLQIVFAVVFIVGMFMTSGMQKRKAQEFHYQAMEAIKDEVGQNNFDRCIKCQNEYIENFLEEKAKAEEAKYRAEHPEDFEDEVCDEHVALENASVETDETNENLENLEVEVQQEIKEEEELDEEKSN